MQVLFTSRDAVSNPMRELAVDRVHFVMRRLGAFVPRAAVQMSDVNGPRGGIDKRCRVQLTTHSTGTIVITSTAREWRTALDGALARAARALLRACERTRARRAQGKRAIAFDS
jgi:ribosome-associated translation inhibitor RaiA